MTLLVQSAIAVVEKIKTAKNAQATGIHILFMKIELLCLFFYYGR